MNAVTKSLIELDADAACKVVLISSSRDSFCNGLDYSKLVQATVEKRKSTSAELSLAVRWVRYHYCTLKVLKCFLVLRNSDFIHTLATFKKTLIAGVTGQAIGIGVTILPLFDLVFASESSTFETPYGRIGQVPEACTAFSLSNKVNQTLVLFINTTKLYIITNFFLYIEKPAASHGWTRWCRNGSTAWSRQ